MADKSCVPPSPFGSRNSCQHLCTCVHCSRPPLFGQARSCALGTGLLLGTGDRPEPLHWMSSSRVVLTSRTQVELRQRAAVLKEKIIAGSVPHLWYRAMVLRSWEVPASFKPPVEILEVLAAHMGAHRIIACVSKDWARAAKKLWARAMVLRSWEVAASFKQPVEILQVLATYMGAHRIIACVSKDWAQAAELSINDLVEKFLNGTFDAQCLTQHSVRSTGVFEQRLWRVVHLSVGEHHALNDLELWWYRTQLHLSLSIGPLKNEKSFKDILRECFEYSEFKGYGFSILERQYREWSENIRPFLLSGAVWTGVFTRSRYVLTRQMRCEMLGKSIKEVLLTLICALRGIGYQQYCGCSICNALTVYRRCRCHYSGCRMCRWLEALPTVLMMMARISERVIEEHWEVSAGHRAP